MQDLISRQSAIELVRDVCDAIMSGCESWYDPEIENEVYKDTREVDAILKCKKEVRIALRNMPSAQPEIIRCKDCKHFELDHFEKVEGFPVPIIVAHEICMKWSDGCRTSKDGWCFMGERRTDEPDDIFE